MSTSLPPTGATQVLVLSTCMTREWVEKSVIFETECYLPESLLGVKTCLLLRKSVCFVLSCLVFLFFKTQLVVFRGHFSNSSIPQNMFPKRSYLGGQNGKPHKILV